MRVEAPAKRLLFVSESFHPGWKCWIDNRPVPVLRVDGDFLGCVCPGGTSEVCFEFQPDSLALRPDFIPLWPRLVGKHCGAESSSLPADERVQSWTRLSRKLICRSASTSMPPRHCRARARGNASECHPAGVQRSRSAQAAIGTSSPMRWPNAESDRKSYLSTMDQVTEAAAFSINWPARHPEVRVIHFSRNFGHQAAVQAGLRHARGHAVVLMDSDYARCPERDRRDFWIAGARDTTSFTPSVCGGRSGHGSGCFFAAFHRLMSSVATTPIPAEAGNFSLIDARAVRQIVTLGERDRYLPGLRSWVGFRQMRHRSGTGRPLRHDRPRVSLARADAIGENGHFFVLSTAAHRVLLHRLCRDWPCFSAWGVFSLYCRLLTHSAIPGWTSSFLSASFFGALNALGISMLGEYVVRIYDQVRARPFYLIDRTVNFAPQTRRKATRPASADIADRSPHATANRRRSARAIAGRNRRTP